VQPPPGGAVHGATSSCRCLGFVRVGPLTREGAHGDAQVAVRVLAELALSAVGLVAGDDLGAEGRGDAGASEARQRRRLGAGLAAEAAAKATPHAGWRARRCRTPLQPLDAAAPLRDKGGLPSQGGAPGAWAWNPSCAAALGCAAHVVARLDRRDALAHALYDARRLVAQDAGEQAWGGVCRGRGGGVGLRGRGSWTGQHLLRG
jgi:hypothetical protein